jgi:hypothetical protein
MVSLCPITPIDPKSVIFKTSQQIFFIFGAGHNQYGIAIEKNATANAYIAAWNVKFLWQKYKHYMS